MQTKHAINAMAAIASICTLTTSSVNAQYAIPSLLITAHIQNFGDMEQGEGRWVGTRGRELRLEGFSIRSNSQCLGLRYMAHVQDVGDTGWFDEGDFVGSRGQDRRLEGLSIKATGPCSNRYSISYKCHIQNQGDSRWMQNGMFCGTRGESKRLEAFIVVIRPR